MSDPAEHTDGKDWDAASATRPVRVSPFADLIGFDLVERTDGRAVVECTVVPAHANTRGIAHGGVVSALMDTAAGGAVAYQPSAEGRPAVTVSLTVNYLHPAHVGDRLRAVAKRAGTGKRIVACQVEVSSSSGALVAVGVATLQLRLQLDAG
jgi:uncharacterized protein (TIGR00369 family)